jgi:hypothetical protein
MCGESAPGKKAAGNWSLHAMLPKRIFAARLIETPMDGHWLPLAALLWPATLFA